MTPPRRSRQPVVAPPGGGLLLSPGHRLDIESRSQRFDPLARPFVTLLRGEHIPAQRRDRIHRHPAAALVGLAELEQGLAVAMAAPSAYQALASDWSSGTTSP